MATTFLALCQRLRQEVGASGTGPASVVGQAGEAKRIVDWVQKADHEIQRLWANWAFHWSVQTVTIVASTKSYALAVRPVAGTLKVSSDTEISLISWREFREYSDTETAAEIQVAAVAPDGTLRVWPSPTSGDTLTFEAYSQPTKLAANTDVSVIPDRHTDVIIYRAKMYYAEYENAPEVMQTATGAYAEALNWLERDQLPDTDAAVGLGGEDYGRVQAV